MKVKNVYVKKKYLRAEMTIEAAVIVPIILSIVMLSIFSAFYYHDKVVLAGAAYETAVVGSTKMREKEEPDESELITLCKERIGRKCIFFGIISVEVDIQKEEVCVRVNATKKWMKIQEEKRAMITDPEKKIRDWRRIKELGDGA